MISFMTSAPQDEGLSPYAISSFLERLYEQEIPLHSLLILKNDKLVFEAYQEPFGRDGLHRMFSITKSLVSMAIGILIGKGQLGLDDRIFTFFPDKVPEDVHPYIAAITIRNMLQMKTAHHKTTYKLAGCVDWVESFFTTQPTHYPGTFFAYDTSSTHVLAALVERLTGMELLDFIRSEFGDELGIFKNAYCLKDPMGVSMGGSGLMATPMDVLKLMYLVANKGRIDGRQYIPEEYLRDALLPWSDNYHSGMTFEEMQGYGYQIWNTQHGGYAFYGLGGQLAVCIPDKNMIVVTTSNTMGRQAGVQLIYNELWNMVYGDEGRECALPAAIPQIYVKGMTVPARDLVIVPDENQQGFTRFELHTDEGSGYLRYEDGSGEHLLEFGMGHNVCTNFPKYGHRALVSGAWRNAGTFVIMAQIIDEYVGKVIMSFTVNGDHAGVVLKKYEETYYKEFDLYTSGEIQGD